MVFENLLSFMVFEILKFIFLFQHSMYYKIFFFSFEFMKISKTLCKNVLTWNSSRNRILWIDASRNKSFIVDKLRSIDEISFFKSQFRIFQNLFFEKTLSDLIRKRVASAQRRKMTHFGAGFNAADGKRDEFGENVWVFNLLEFWHVAFGDVGVLPDTDPARFYWTILGTVVETFRVEMSICFAAGKCFWKDNYFIIKEFIEVKIWLNQ